MAKSVRFAVRTVYRKVLKCGREMFGHCSEVVRKPIETSAKHHENRYENCADLSKRRSVILHSSESGIEQPVQVVRQADSDDQLIALWLHGRPDHTQRAYRAEMDRFILYIEKPLRLVKRVDIQEFIDHLTESSLKPSSFYRAMSAVKSLFAFGFRLGYLQSTLAVPSRYPASETNWLNGFSVKPRY